MTEDTGRLKRAWRSFVAKVEGFERGEDIYKSGKDLQNIIKGAGYELSSAGEGEIKKDGILVCSYSARRGFSGEKSRWRKSRKVHSFKIFAPNQELIFPEKIKESAENILSSNRIEGRIVYPNNPKGEYLAIELEDEYANLETLDIIFRFFSEYGKIYTPKQAPEHRSDGSERIQTIKIPAPKMEWITNAPETRIGTETLKRAHGDYVVGDPKPGKDRNGKEIFPEQLEKEGIVGIYRFLGPGESRINWIEQEN